MIHSGELAKTMSKERFEGDLAPKLEYGIEGQESGGDFKLAGKFGGPCGLWR
jgi:hypothetical protein